MAPLVQGGQGKTEADVRESASVIAWLLGIAVVMVVILSLVGGVR